MPVSLLVRIFFGFVIRFETEFRCFPFSELKSGKGLLGLPIEQDLHFESKILRELMNKH